MWLLADRLVHILSFKQIEVIKTIQIQGEKREEVGGKNSKALRREGMVPCVVYGGKENVHFSVDIRKFDHLIKTRDVFLVILDINGAEHKAILKAVQFHPVSDLAIHADFFEVVDDVPFEVSIPVSTLGASPGVLNGGVLRLVRRKLRLKGLMNAIPESFELDITSLKIGDSIKVRDLNYPGVEFLEPEGGDVVAIRTARGAIEDEEPDDEEGEEGAEGAEGAAAEGGEEAKAEAPAEA